MVSSYYCLSKKTVNSTFCGRFRLIETACYSPSLNIQFHATQNSKDFYNIDQYKIIDLVVTKKHGQLREKSIKFVNCLLVYL